MNNPQVALVPSTTDNYKWKAFWVVALALFTMVMDFSVTGIALPTIADDFSLSLSIVSWVAIAGALTISALLLPLGRFADIAGRKRVHLIAMGLFAIGSVFAAASPNLQSLIGARVVMAIGGAMDQAVVMAIVTSVFPPGERGKGLGLITTAVGTGGIAGPIIGGPLIELFGWRSVYIFMAIPTLISFTMALFILDDKRIGTVRQIHRQPYDWVGAITSATFLGLFIFLISNPLNLGFASAPFLALSCFAALSLGIFIFRELHTAAPMINLRLFQIPVFRWATVSRFLGFFGNSPVFFLMPFYVQNVLGKTPSVVGMVTFIGAFFFAVTGTVSGRLSDRFGHRVFTIAGLGGATISSLICAQFTPTTPLYVIMSTLAVNGISNGLWTAPNMSATLGAVDRVQYGIVSAFLNLVRNTASVISIASATAVVSVIMVGRGFSGDLDTLYSSSGLDGGEAFSAGMKVVFVFMAGVSFAGLLAATMGRDR